MLGYKDFQKNVPSFKVCSVGLHLCLDTNESAKLDTNHIVSEADA